MRWPPYSIFPWVSIPLLYGNVTCSDLRPEVHYNCAAGYVPLYLVMISLWHRPVPRPPRNFGYSVRYAIMIIMISQYTIPQVKNLGLTPSNVEELHQSRLWEEAVRTSVREYFKPRPTTHDVLYHVVWPRDKHACCVHKIKLVHVSAATLTPQQPINARGENSEACISGSQVWSCFLHPQLLDDDIKGWVGWVNFVIGAQI